MNYFLLTNLKKTSLLCLLLGMVTFTFAQNTITGVITDVSSSEPLIGANVLVQELNTGTATDFDGNYALKLDDGTYTLMVTYTGYAAKKAIVTVDGGQQVTQDFTLSSDALGLDEVVVTATFGSRSQKERKYKYLCQCF